MQWATLALLQLQVRSDRGRMMVGLVPVPDGFVLNVNETDEADFAAVGDEEIAPAERRDVANRVTRGARVVSVEPLPLPAAIARAESIAREWLAAEESAS